MDVNVGAQRCRLPRTGILATAAGHGCSRHDIAKVKTLIADHGITGESFIQLDPSFFDEHFSDHRGARRRRYDQPDFEKLARRLANNKHLTRHRLWTDYIAADAQATKR